MKVLILFIVFIISIFFLSSVFSLAYVMVTQENYSKNKSYFSKRVDLNGCDDGKSAQFYKFHIYAKPERICKKKK